MSSGKGLSVFLVEATQRCILCLTCDTTVDTCVVFSDVLAGKDLVCPHQFTARHVHVLLSDLHACFRVPFWTSGEITRTLKVWFIFSHPPTPGILMESLVR